MKPRYLEMKAFGSFREEAIDFTSLNHGIFLITGDTGAGKTTIFDAIVYALYGETSGGKRSGKMMRSQYAPDSMRTEVTFRFLYANQEYTIIRSPEQPNYKLNKKSGRYEALKKPLPAKVELIMPDKTPFCGKAAEIDGTKNKIGKIEEIIGLNARQFTQIAMLAQGDFLKLLLAPSEERKAIFAKLFDTKLYALMEDEIELRFKEKGGQLEENANALQRELERISCIKESVYAEQCNQLHSAKVLTLDKEELLDIVNHICQEAKAKRKEIKSKKQECENALTILDLKLKQANDINLLFEKLEENQEKLRLLEEQESASQQIKQKLEMGLRANAVAAYEHAYNRAKKEQETCLEQKLQLKKQLEKIKERLESLSVKAQEDNIKLEEAAPRLNIQISNLEQSMSKYEEMEGLIRSLDNLYEQLKAAEDEKERSARQKKCLEQEIEQLEQQIWQLKEEARSQLLLQDQIKYLRSQLKDGQPCPVCGQIHHDKKALNQELKDKMDENVQIAGAGVSHETEYAEDSQDAESEIFYAAKIEEKEKRKNKLAEQQSVCAAALEIADRKREELKIRQSREEASLAVLKEMLIYTDKEEAKAQLHKKHKKLIALREEQEKSANSFQQAQAEMNQKQGEYQEKKKQSELAAQEFERASKEYKEKLLLHSFQSAQEFEEAFLDLSEITKLRQQVSDYETKRKLAIAETQRLQEETRQKERIDAQKLLEKKEACRQEKDALDALDNELCTIVSNNESAYKRSQQLLRERERLFSSYFVLNHLNNTANGKLSKRHLNFQTFIQRSYFKKVISNANKRLYPMSGGQFILQRRDLDKLGTQGSVGLDLDVYSIVNGQARDVKTLSGGESFMAALSMALGMADLIQNSRGSVHIDTMFIDEGFGALSEETRNQAVAILNELSEGKRLVGIISHVSELKSQIETQMIVRKTGKGSKAEWRYE